MHDKVNASVPDSTLLVIEQVKLERAAETLHLLHNYFTEPYNSHAINMLQRVENTLQSLLLNK